MNKLFYIFIVIFSVTSLISKINAADFTDCGSKIGKFTSVDVAGCEKTQKHCILKRGSNATISIDFDLVESDTCSAVNTIVHGIILDVPIPFPLKNPDGCVNSGITCPIEKGQNYKYFATLPVLKNYPKVNVMVKWELKNENEEIIVCVLIPAKVE